MPLLIVLRHAKSDQSPGVPDNERPLAHRGRVQAPEAGRWLAENVGTIDLAVVSPAVRARTTWELAAAELDPAPPLRVEDEVYNASVDDLLDVLRDLPDEAGTVVLVGHNPGLEELVATLTDEPTPMPTSALAVLELTDAWSAVGPGAASLRTSGRPPKPL